MRMSNTLWAARQYSRNIVCRVWLILWPSHMETGWIDWCAKTVQNTRPCGWILAVGIIEASCVALCKWQGMYIGIVNSIDCLNSVCVHCRVGPVKQPRSILGSCEIHRSIFLQPSSTPQNYTSFHRSIHKASVRYM